jgi:hypothetical protein
VSCWPAIDQTVGSARLILMFSATAKAAAGKKARPHRCDQALLLPIR